MLVRLGTRDWRLETWGGALGLVQSYLGGYARVWYNVRGQGGGMVTALYVSSMVFEADATAWWVLPDKRWIRIDAAVNNLLASRERTQEETKASAEMNSGDSKGGGGSSVERVQLSRTQIVAFCQRNRIRWLALFGSVLQDDFGPHSDVDVLVEFEPQARLGLMAYARIQRELSELLQRPVDLVTRDGLKPLIKQDVLDSAEVIYAA